MTEAEQDEQAAMDQCIKALSSFRNGGLATNVMMAIDALICIRIAEFAEEMARRVEAKAAKEADHANG